VELFRSINEFSNRERCSMFRLRAVLRWVRGSGHLGKSPRRGTRTCQFRPKFEALEDRQVPTVSFFGGNLLPQVQAQALYLGNAFSSAPASTETATLDAFLKDLTGGPYLQALERAGYNVGPGSAVAGAVDGTALTVGSTIS